MKFYKELIKGLWEENPIFRLVLGMCPTLAVTTSVENGLGMGVAATFVLVCSNVVISLVRNFIPSKVRIPCFIVVIATFVTIVDMMMNAYAPELHKALGLFIPLIVVNCIILGRAEAFASKNPVMLSIADGIGMGVGFTLGLVVVAAFRELLGAGTITIWGDIGIKVSAITYVLLKIPGVASVVKWFLAQNFQPMILMVLAPGGFLALGLILGFMNSVQARIAKRKGKSFTTPAHLDCRHCTICKFGE